MKMKNSARYWPVLTILCGVHAFAGEEIAWGDAVDGLRVGITYTKTRIASDEPLMFTVTIKNTSDHALTIPAPEAYMPKAREDMKGFHARPLHPQIEKVSGADKSYSLTGAQDLKTVSTDVRVLKAGEALVLADLPLHEFSFCDGHDDYSGKTTVCRWMLMPDSVYRVSYSFENDASEVAQRKLWTGKAVSAGLEIRMTRPSADGFGLAGVFSLPKTDYFLFEPIHAEFRLTNKGNAQVRFPTGCDYAGTGRHERFSFTAVDDKGVRVKDPVIPSGMGGGLGGNMGVKPGETYTEMLLVNQWCAFERPGKYTLTCKRTVNIVTGGASSDLQEAMLPALPVETTFAITIRDDAKALAARLETLEAQFAGKDSDLAADELAALARARCEAALPLVLKVMNQPGSYQRQALGWLKFFGKDTARARAAMLKAATSADAPVRSDALQVMFDWDDPAVAMLIKNIALESRDAEERRAAVLLCSKRKIDGCLLFLMSMEHDKDAIVRRYLSAALAEYGDKYAIPVLLRLLADPDPDPFIRIWAAGSLGKLGRKDGVPVMIGLLKVEAAKGAHGNIVNTLEELTGKRFAADEDWNKWWETEGKP